jgi:uncharacterized SAM-binding protein YcdF (DUF218 family)
LNTFLLTYGLLLLDEKFWNWYYFLIATENHMDKKSKYKSVKKITDATPQGLSGSRSSYFYWGILLLVIFFTTFIRIRLLSIPLERDEGEFAYMGQLILQGIPPYLISYNMKLPGIYAAYALIMSIFGESIEGIHLGFLFINAATIIMVFLLTKRLYDSYTGIIAGASFAILSVSPSVLGTSAHATHFVLLPALGGIFLMLKAIDSGKWKQLFWSGIILGISFIMKQPGVFFIIFVFLYLLFNLEHRHYFPPRTLLKQGALFLFGSILPFVLTFGILYMVGVFERFWFWTFSYAYEYASQIPFSTGLEILFGQIPNIMGHFYLLWGVAGLGISALFLDKTSRTHAPFILGFLVFSFLAVCPGLYFREHYFVLILPAVSLLIGMGIRSLKRLILKFQPKFQWMPAILFLVAFLIGVVQYGSFFFKLTPFEACRALYGYNPFPESIGVAEYIKRHSERQDKIAVLGSEPQIYFYSNRRSATGYIYMYGLMEDQKYALKMQKEMAEEIEKAKPTYLIFVNIPTSWLARERSERYVFDWFEAYHENQFSLVGIVDIYDKTEYRWDQGSHHYSPRSPLFLCIYKSKTRGDSLNVVPDSERK